MWGSTNTKVLWFWPAEVHQVMMVLAGMKRISASVIVKEVSAMTDGQAYIGVEVVVVVNKQFASQLESNTDYVAEFIQKGLAKLHEQNNAKDEQSNSAPPSSPEGGDGNPG